jgi:hypothetical protein
MSSVRILRVIKLQMVSLTPTQHPWYSQLSKGKGVSSIWKYTGWLVESEMKEVADVICGAECKL